MVRRLHRHHRHIQSNQKDGAPPAPSHVIVKLPDDRDIKISVTATTTVMDVRYGDG